MQYTQQQRLAPEVPDESALYSPIAAVYINMSLVRVQVICEFHSYEQFLCS